MEFLNNLSPVAAAILGTVVGAAGGILTTLITKHYDNKKSIRDSFVALGIKNWDGLKELAKRHADKGGKGNLAPLDMTLIHNARLLKLIEKDDVSKESLNELYADMRVLKKAVEKHSREIKKAAKKRVAKNFRLKSKLANPKA